MSEAQPIVVFVPPGLDAAAAASWRDSMLADLGDAGLVTASNRRMWELALDETGVTPLPTQASGSMLLISAFAPPIYLWVTMAQPAGNPIGLGEAVLDTQFPAPTRKTRDQPDDGGRVDARAGSTIAQGYRIGPLPQEDGSRKLVQVSVTVATLTLDGAGETDVCLWFATPELETVDELLPVVANLMDNPDLADYLTA